MMSDAREGSPDSIYSAEEGNGSGRAARPVEGDSEEGMIRLEAEVEVDVEDRKAGRGRKRLVKKALVDESDDEDRGRGREHIEVLESEEEESERIIFKKQRGEVEDVYGEKGGKGGKGAKVSSSKVMAGKKGEKEMKEMWDSVAGNGDESGEDDERFIDDEGVAEEDRVVYSDGKGSDRDRRHPEAEEAEEVEDEEDGRLFGKGMKKKKKLERTPEEIAMFVEQFMAKLDVAAETDADLNRASKPAIEKLKMLGELWTVLQRRQLQMEFLDRGVLSSLKNWLEPLPDGSLPNMNIRTTLLKLLTDLPIDAELFERREQLKKSGLGKVVMFLSRLPEETPSNKKLARDLVDKWSRPIFQKSTRYEDLRMYDEERPQPRRSPMKKAP